MDDKSSDSIWICHVCATTGRGESITCSHCFKVACAEHIQHVDSFNRETGLYQLMPICLDCAIRETIK